MRIDKKKELSKYRFEQAEQCLLSADVLLNIEDYRGAANRAYYAIYHAVRSIIALDGVEFKRHSGNFSYFRQTYIKTRAFDVQLSEIITLAADARGSSDYDDFYIISKSEVEEQISNAKLFLDQVGIYLQSRNSEGDNTLDEGK